MPEPLLLLGGGAGLALLANLAWRLHLFQTYLRFVRLVREGRLEEANRVFERLLAHSPRLVENSPLLGQAAVDPRLLGSPVPDERLRQFLHGLTARGRELRPRSALFLRLEANLLRQEGDLDQGMALLEEAVRLEPGEPINLQQRGWFRELSGQLDPAAEDYQQALERVPRGRRPERLRASLLRSLSQTRSRQGRLEEAARALEEAVRVDLPSTEGALTRVALAGLHERQGNLDAAVAILREGLDAGPDQGLLRQSLASILVRAGRYEEAEVELEDPATADMDPVARSLTRADLESARGRQAEALGWLEEAQGQAPRNPAVQLALARHHERTGDDARAMVHYERAVEAASARGPWTSLRDAVWLSPRERLADCYARLGRLDDAEREYRRALKEGATNPSLKASLGAVLTRLGRGSESEALLREAREALEDSLRRVPGDPRLHQALASLLLAGGEVLRAREHLEQSLALGPADFFTWRDLGEVHFLAGRRDEAREAWTKALPLAGRADLEQQIRERLARLEGQA